MLWDVGVYVVGLVGMYINCGMWACMLWDVGVHVVDVIVCGCVCCMLWVYVPCGCVCCGCRFHVVGVYVVGLVGVYAVVLRDVCLWLCCGFVGVYVVCL